MNTIHRKSKCIIYLIVLLLLCPAIMNAAQRKVALKERAITIKQAIKLIEKKSDYTFFFKESDIDDQNRKDINCNGTINEVLDELFKGSNVSYVIKNNDIILKASQTEPKTQQQKDKRRSITGAVIDSENNDPIIGASVILKGKKEGVITDVNGNFTINVYGSNPQLEVSYIGYKKKVIDVGDLGVVRIKMDADNQMLNEVVVVGAGTQKKVSVTGSITSIKGLELKAPSSSLTNSFAGKLAGVIAMTKSGEPGSSSEFYIRGVGTFGGRATPLILLDDVEISSNDLNNIPPETIESFSILKDASATAIYGSRGANGVMLVTTKTGRENEKTRINVSVEAAIKKPNRQPQFVDGATYMSLYNEALTTRTPEASLRFSNEAIDATRSHLNPYVYPDVNWSDLIFRGQSSSQKANINISGGGSKATYFMSLNANHDTGLLNTKKAYSWNNNINNWAYNFQNNISYKVSPTTRIDLHMNAQIRNSKGPNYSTTDLFNMMLTANPVTFPAVYPAQEGDTHIRFGNTYKSGSNMWTNPYAYMLTSFKETNQNTLNTSLKVSQDLDFITKGLNVSMMINWKNWSSSSYNRTIEPYYYRVKDGSYDPVNPVDYELERVGSSGTDYIAQSDISKASDQTFYMDARLNYARMFGLHHVSGMLMYMQREYRNSVLPTRNQGLSGRITYDYGQRYLLEMNFGYNGTERLAKGERFELFPAVSLGWVVSNETFFEPFTKIIDNLKIRGSYGLVGSDETGLLSGAHHFLYIDDVTLNDISYTTGIDLNKTMKGPQVKQYGVKNAGWERVKKLNIGLDMSLFRCLNLTAEYFFDRRYNILLHREAWPESLGYYVAKPWSNVGKVNNSGFELSVNLHKMLLKDLFIDVRTNFTYTANKYVDTDEPLYPYYWTMQTGKPLSRTLGYIAEGLFKSQEEIENSPKQNLGSVAKIGDIKYRDLNGDAKITEDDRTVISQYGGTPRIQYGLGVNLTYKRFDFGVFFNGSLKRSIMLGDIHPFGQGDYNVMKFIAEDHWSETNPNFEAKYPRLGLVGSQIANNTQSSTFWMRNGSFIRFKTLELGYSLPFGRIYLSGDNLAVFSSFKHWDPELAWNSYPLQRTFNLGVQFNF